MCAVTDGAMTAGVVTDAARTDGQRRVALVTGASSGIGAATVRALAAAGLGTVAAARRVERCEELAAEVGGRALRLDVTDDASVAALAEQLDRVDVVVHSAGGALGADRIEDADLEQWRWMYDANVLGVLRVHNALLPKLRASGNGHVVVVGSIAGFEVYPGGAGYTGAKHAVNALCRTLRLELVGEPIRVTEVAPGMVETEFSTVRFGGDAERAAAVYRGLQPLTAEDVAEVVAFCVTRPAHVDIDHVVVRPVSQASATVAARREE
jgi:NADP-dependent 3-hydroxy acid dehydrogenase YdfG